MKDWTLNIVFTVCIVGGVILLWLGGVHAAHEAHEKKLCYPEAMVASGETDIQCANSKIVWSEKTGWKRVTQ